MFFDTAKIRYRYEPEGYSLNGLYYLPDFYLPDQSCFVEIKGNAPTYIEQRLAFLLAKQSRNTVHIFGGGIPLPDIKSWDKDGFSIYTFTGNRYNNGRLYSPYIYALNQCPKCRKIDFCVNGRIASLPCGCVKKSQVYRFLPGIRWAFISARSARFEFGEHGI